MKAIVLPEFGPAKKFTAQNLPDPEPRPGELLVAVEAGSVNPVDTKIRSGALAVVSPELPGVLHGDVTGTVKAVGEGVTDFAPGDRVWACGGGVKGCDGALAELMRVDARLAAPAPKNLEAAKAGVLPLVGITAWQAVVDRAGVRPGQHVLVHGGSGGVGHVAVQLARAAGARVTATVSQEPKADVVRELGAEEVVIGRDAPEAAFDVVIDTLGGENLGKSFTQIATHGTVVTIAARTTADCGPLHAKAATLHVVFMLLPLLTGKGREEHGRILRDLSSLVEAERVRPLISEQFPIPDVAAAHESLEEGRHIGKIALCGW
jgi:NADPH2:quinone reductase